MSREPKFGDVLVKAAQSREFDAREFLHDQGWTEVEPRRWIRPDLEWPWPQADALRLEAEEERDEL